MNNIESMCPLEVVVRIDAHVRFENNKKQHKNNSNINFGNPQALCKSKSQFCYVLAIFGSEKDRIKDRTGSSPDRTGFEQAEDQIKTIKISAKI